MARVIPDLQLKVHFTPNTNHAVLVTIGVEFCKQECKKDVAIKPVAACIAAVSAT
jgi:hypothetical protein